MPNTLSAPVAQAARSPRRGSRRPTADADAGPLPSPRAADAANDEPLVAVRQLTLSTRLLLQVALATMLVSGLPIALVWWLRASGTVSSVALGAFLGMTLSLCASGIGCLLWEKHPGSEDLLFSELMAWGFIHRWRSQRRLACAIDMVGPMSDVRTRAANGVSVEQQARLLEQLVLGMETRDPYLHGHSRRVARYSWMIAARMGLPREQLARIRTAAAIHDVGKVRTPKAVLHKPGRLTDAEFEVIKRHPDDGARMAAALNDPRLTAIVRHHHERLDGSGYPDGLSGSDIPLGARIIAVADTFDAITSSRPYRAASAHKKAIDILKDDAGTRLDPAVVRAFCGHYAGRRPVAFWAALAGVPDRLATWLGGSVAGIASAAKTVAVAALVGGTAASSTLALAPARHHRGPKHASASAAARTAGASAVRPHAGAGGAAGGVPGAGALRPTGRSPRRRAGLAVGVTPAAASTRAPGSATPATGAAPASPSGDHGKPETTHGTRQEGSAPGKPEEAKAKANGEEAPSKGKPVEVPSRGKVEEPLPSVPPVEAAKAKIEEAAKAKVEEVKAKVEEVKAKVEEVKGKVGEIAGGVTGGLPKLR